MRNAKINIKVPRITQPEKLKMELVVYMAFSQNI